MSNTTRETESNMVFDSEIIEEGIIVEPETASVSNSNLDSGQKVAEDVLTRLGMENCFRLDITPEKMHIIENGVIFRNVFVNRNSGRGNIRVLSSDKNLYRVTITLNARNFSPEEVIADWQFLNIINTYLVIEALWR